MPDSIEPSIRSYGKCAKPVPLAGIDRVVIDSLRYAEGQTAVCAAHKHHVGRASPGRHHAGQHVNVVVSRSAGVIDRQEYHSIQTGWINPPETEEPTQIDGGASVKSWRLGRDLRIARAHAKERAGSFTADKQVTIRVHVERSVCRRVTNGNWWLPSDPAVNRTLKLHPAAAAVNAVV